MKEVDRSEAMTVSPSQLWPLSAFTVLNAAHQVLLEQHNDLDEASAQEILSTSGSIASLCKATCGALPQSYIIKIPL